MTIHQLLLDCATEKLTMDLFLYWKVPLTIFSRRQISNAIVEVTPGHGFWENVGVTQEEVAETLSRVASFGYKMVSLYDYSIHNTADEVYDYILKATFSKQHGQSDIWLTLDDVDASAIAETCARCTSISKSRARVADSGRLDRDRGAEEEG